ncbi:MAG: amidohydrolase family protein [Herbinix sp.]|nr:amidohydrolase family protein [Herbinix sp.]
MIHNKADLVLISSSIFTSLSNEPQNGFIAIQGENIIKVGKGDDYKAYADDRTSVINLGDKTVCAGFTDTHTFFTGYVIDKLGINLGSIDEESDLETLLYQYYQKTKHKEAIFGNNLPDKFLKSEILHSMIERISPNKPVVLFNSGHSTCVMNQAAINTFGFNPDKCNSEALHKIMKLYLTDREFIDDEFTDYMKMLNKRGITAVKEMGFDDFYGFTEVLDHFDKQNKLTVRISFMSQPVGSKTNISYGKEMREKFNSEFVQFSGYNQMTDGLILNKQGHLLNPYEGTNTCCEKAIDYKSIEEEVLEADRNGFRFTLHSEGDGAFHQILNIYEKCEKISGKLKNRHGITDLEMTSLEDRRRMADLGAFGEIYTQIYKYDPYEIYQYEYEKVIGKTRTSEYLNYRDLVDKGVILAAATDLPLLIPSVPEAIYYGCANYCKDKKERMNPNNALTIPEMLKAWTINAQYALERDNILGTLEEGKRADIVVFDSNIFTIPIEQMLDVNTEITIVNGKIVYSK